MSRVDSSHESKRSPRIVVLAGPNGAGKSTVAPRILRQGLQVDEFVNADVIARGLSASDPESVAFTAGRLMLERIRELAARRVDFAFETTLASRTFAPWIRRWSAEGYEVHLVYVWIPNPEFANLRVAQRVRDGGHRVPAPTVTRRFRRSLSNFRNLYRPLCKRWHVYANLDLSGLRLVATGSPEDVERVEDPNLWSEIAHELS